MTRRAFSIGALAVAAHGANTVGAVRLTLEEDELEVELLRGGSYAPSLVAEGDAVVAGGALAATQAVLPGALVERVRYRAPYSAVRGLVRREGALCLALDPMVVAPFNRLTLTRFTDAPLDALVGAHRARARAQRAMRWLPLPLAVAAAAAVPSYLAAGPLGRLAVGALAGLVAFWVLRRFTAWVTHGGPVAARFRDAFEAELAWRLGLEAVVDMGEPYERPAQLRRREDTERRTARGSAPPVGRAATSARPAQWPPQTLRPSRPAFPAPSVPPQRAPSAPVMSSAAASPRRLAVAAERAPALTMPRGPSALRAPEGSWWKRSPLGSVAVIALAIIGLLFAYREVGNAAGNTPASVAQDVLSFGASDEKVELTELATTGWGTVVGEIRKMDLRVPAPYPRCSCARSDSPLWRDGLPAVSWLPASRDSAGNGRPASHVAPKADEEGVFRYDFDLAIVNNTAHNVRDVRTVLTFARRDDSGHRTDVTDRGLFWEGALGPGRSVKWQVEGPGTEVRIDTDELGLLDPSQVAPADRFYALSRANLRVVRLHSAMMLAYLGDPRAATVARGLSSLSEAEEQIRDSILRATGPLRVCSAETSVEPATPAVPADEEAHRICVFNAGDKPVDGFAVREVFESPRSVSVDFQLPVHEGFSLAFPLQGGDVPNELEAIPAK